MRPPNWREPDGLQELVKDYLSDPGPNASRALAAGLIQSALTLPQSQDFGFGPERQAQPGHTEYPEAPGESPPPPNETALCNTPLLASRASSLISCYPIGQDGKEASGASDSA